jgi:hypothetical protein
MARVCPYSGRISSFLSVCARLSSSKNEVNITLRSHEVHDSVATRRQTYPMHTVSIPRFRISLIAALTMMLAGVTAFSAAPAEAQTAGYQTSAPQFVQVTRASDTEIRVSWLPPQTANSPIQRYKVTVVASAAEGLPNPSQYIVNANTTAVTFRNMKAGFSYYFQVQPETQAGAGQPSDLSAPFILPSPADRKPNPPTNVVASLAGTNQAVVVWNMSAAKQDVNVVKYRITTYPSTKTIEVGLTNTTVLNNLKPGLTYYAQVQAISSEKKMSDPGVSNPLFIPLPTPAVTAAPVTLPPATTTTTTTSTTTTTLVLPLPSPVEVPALPVAKRCTSRVWSPTLLGQPSRLVAGAPVGAYIWTDGRAIHLRTYNNSTTPVRFSGTVSAQTSMATARFYTESDSDSISVGRTAASFSFLSAYDIDALRFDGRCVTKLTVKLFLNGQPMAPTQIFIGANNINPTTSAFILSR